MKAVKANAASGCYDLQSLEERRLMAYGYWPRYVNMDDVFTQYPWLDGGGNGVAVIDKGIDYYHPALGGDRANGIKSPRVVNVFDYEDNDNDPYPTTTDTQDPQAGHATGIAGILAGLPMTRAGEQYKGILQNSLLYNLRENVSGDTQNSINSALQWVVANHAALHITAVDLTDFFGTQATTAVYNAAAQTLWNAGVFMITPVANNFQGVPEDNIPPRTAINNPGSNPYIFATGGLMRDGTISPKTQRGPDLDVLAPADHVTIAYYSVTGTPDIYVDNAADGNSWGTPHVVGTAVMIQQIDPTATPAEIMQIIKDSGPKVLDTDTVTDPNQNIYYSRLDMLAAIQLAYSRRDDSSDAGAGNDTLANATFISLSGSKQGSVTGRKLLIHDHDYYTFNLTSGGSMDISLGYSGPSAFPTGELLDNTGTVIGTIGQGGLTKTLAAGQYYVHLYNASKSLSGAYSVNISGAGTGGSSVGQNGSYNDIAYDKSNRLNFAWYDESSGSLKYAQRSAGNVWSNTTVVDSSASGVGQFVSMALDSNGRPGLAYYDSFNANLKYAHFNGSSWNVEVVDAKNTTGYYPSLKFNNSNQPVISYYYKTGGDLRFAARSSGGWSVTAIDTGGDVGRFSSLGLNPASGQWAVAYEASTAGSFKYATQTMSSWAITTVDTPGQGGGYVSLAFDRNKQPAFSYYDAKNADLKFARYNGTRWSTTTVASKNSQGLYTNLFFDANNSGNPVIYFYNRTNNTLSAARSNGKSFVFQLLASGGGRSDRVALKTDGSETFSWQDSGGDLNISDL